MALKGKGAAAKALPLATQWLVNEAGKIDAGAKHPADRAINALERWRLGLGIKYFKIVRLILLRIKLKPHSLTVLKGRLVIWAAARC